MPSSLPAGARSQPIPDALRAALAPAQVALFEWTDYFFHWPGADVLQVDERRIEPVAPGTFRVRWENALGLASLTPLFQGEPLEAPLWVEILSPKFPTPALHVAFLGALLERLFRLSPHLVWHHAGATARGASASNRAMSAPETLDWALAWGAELEQTLAALARQPARDWVAHQVDATPAQVEDLSAAQLSTLAGDGARWQRGAVVGGWAPARVPQTRRRQSFDTSDNRGALAFVEALESALNQAQNGQWWHALNQNQRQRIVDLQRNLCGWRARWPEPVSAPREMWRPRAAPYRALWQLQQSWRGAGAPLWQHAERLARVRDIATLWELWVFFDLIERIESAREGRADLEIKWDEARGILAPSRARWGEYTLTFNGPAPSYSTPLRPDYLWSKEGRAVAAFDAKFRFEAGSGSGRGADLHKMHAYRDALGVSAAIALHPGNRTIFFDRERGPISRLPLPAILSGAAAGVGLWGFG